MAAVDLKSLKFYSIIEVMQNPNLIKLGRIGGVISHVLDNPRSDASKVRQGSQQSRCQISLIDMISKKTFSLVMFSDVFQQFKSKSETGFDVGKCLQMTKLDVVQQKDNVFLMFGNSSVVQLLAFKAENSNYKLLEDAKALVGQYKNGNAAYEEPIIPVARGRAAPLSSSDEKKVKEKRVYDNAVFEFENLARYKNESYKTLCATIISIGKGESSLKHTRFIEIEFQALDGYTVMSVFWESKKPDSKDTSYRDLTAELEKKTIYVGLAVKFSGKIEETEDKFGNKVVRVNWARPTAIPPQDAALESRVKALLDRSAKIREQYITTGEVDFIPKYKRLSRHYFSTDGEGAFRENQRELCTLQTLSNKEFDSNRDCLFYVIGHVRSFMHGDFQPKEDWSTLRPKQQGAVSPFYGLKCLTEGCASRCEIDTSASGTERVYLCKNEGNHRVNQLREDQVTTQGSMFLTVEDSTTSIPMKAYHPVVEQLLGIKVADIHQDAIGVPDLERHAKIQAALQKSYLNWYLFKVQVAHRDHENPRYNTEYIIKEATPLSKAFANIPKLCALPF